MSSADLADLFPGFAVHWVDTRAGRILPAPAAPGRPCFCSTDIHRLMFNGIRSPALLPNTSA